MCEFKKLSNLLIILEELGLPTELVEAGLYYMRFHLTLKSGRIIYISSSVSLNVGNKSEILHILGME